MIGRPTRLDLIGGPRLKSISVRAVRTLKVLRREIALIRSRGESLALVPTMGALHDGHLALVKLAKKKADRAVVSIFVNPKQFAPHEDFSRYPRREADDIAKLAAVAADLVWLPRPAEMYPANFATHIAPEGAAQDLETEFRPHFFGGVTTVVAKLFNQVTPDLAIFGEKDFQQLTVIKQLVRDLDMPLKVVGAPTTRARDGLALSSRNAYLSDAERQIAPALIQILRDTADRARRGGNIHQIRADATLGLLQAGFTKVDYVDVRDADTLGPYQSKSGRKGRALAAAWLGKTRLIDNVGV